MPRGSAACVTIVVMPSCHTRRFTLAVVTAAAALAALANPAAFEITLDRPALTRAVKLARWPATDADRAACHARYVFTARDEPAAPIRIDRIEVTTEFRRLELIAEQHARLNDLWGRTGTGDAEAALQPWRGAVSITALASYRNIANVSLDLQEIAIRLADPATAARSIKRSFEYSGSCATDQFGCQITGATIAAEFEAAPLARAVRPVVVEWKGRPLAQVTVDFRPLE
jgi:hypothetical protein